LTNGFNGLLSLYENLTHSQQLFCPKLSSADISESNHLNNYDGDDSDRDDSNEIDVSQYIYQIKATKCQAKPSLRLQTGVRIQGYSGIVTALHGIVGCKEIIATSHPPTILGELPIVSDLEISQVDIGHDIALLTPKGIEAQKIWKPTEGLLPLETLLLPECPRVSPFQVFLWGYPEPYIEIITRPGDVICRTELRKRMPPLHPQRAFLSARNSPHLSTYILDVAIIATHGYSGAPLLVHDTSLISDTNRVAGIVIGGLPTDIANAWAVPWQEVELLPVELAAEKIDDLARRNLSETLMTYLGSDTPLLTGEDNIVTKDVVLNQSGTIRIDLVEAYAQVGLAEAYPRTVWLVVFAKGSDPYVDEPLTRLLITVPWASQTKLYFERSAMVRQNIEGRLKTNGTVELEAYLFSNNVPFDRFNREGDPPWDEPIPLASGENNEGFLLKRNDIDAKTPNH
jgi:hypothetical protein